MFDLGKIWCAWFLFISITLPNWTCYRI